MTMMTLIIAKNEFHPHDAKLNNIIMMMMMIILIIIITIIIIIIIIIMKIIIKKMNIKKSYILFSFM